MARQLNPDHTLTLTAKERNALAGYIYDTVQQCYEDYDYYKDNEVRHISDIVRLSDEVDLDVELRISLDIETWDEPEEGPCQQLRGAEVDAWSFAAIIYDEDEEIVAEGVELTKEEYYAVQRAV